MGSCAGRLWWKNLKSNLPGKHLAKIYLIVFINFFANAYAITMLFPFLPFMVEHLKPGISKTSVGHYVGYVGGALFIGRFFGSYFWGVLADQKGRKPVIISSGICMGLSVVVFGFSVNIWMAIATRILVGFFNGIITSCKAIVYEASDDRNQAFGLSVLGAAWGCGLIIGPALSGALADPIGQYNLTITNSFIRGFLTKFPYSPPCIANLIIFIFGVILIVYFLPETLGKNKNYKRSEINQDLTSVHVELENRSTASSLDNDNDKVQNNTDDQTRLLQDKELSGHIENLFISNPTTCEFEARIDRSSQVVLEECSSVKVPQKTKADRSQETEGDASQETEGDGCHETEMQEVFHVVQSSRTKSLRASLKLLLKDSLSDLKLFFCDRTILTILILYSVYSYAVIGYYETYSLWAYTQPHYGGLGFSLHEIGIVLSVVGVLMLPVTLFTFPIMVKYLKSIKTFYVIAIISMFFLLMIPHLHYLINIHNTYLLWVSLISTTFIINGSFSLGFSAIFLLTNNSVTFDKLGSLNGIAMAMTSLTRSISPVLSGAFFSFSLSETTMKIGFPLDYNFVFVTFSVVILICVLLVSCLPVSINHQKIIEDE